MGKKVERIPHHASLVGNIVEKGFSSPDSGPTSTASFLSPTVLPFPVARHRSHGPHWTPAGAVADDEDGVEEDRDETDYNPIAGFAKPVQKKVKKGMDFSGWRKLVSDEGKMRKVASSAAQVKKVKSCTRSKEVGVKSEVTKVEAAESNGKECSLVLTNSEAVGNGVKDRIDVNWRVEVSRSEGGDRDTVDSSAGVSCASVCASTENLMASKNGELTTSPSLEDDIDAENRARLNEMSHDEIAEAQAEMMNKMNPAILEMLKKRGRDKLEAKKVPRASNADKESTSLKGKSQVGGKSSLTKESMSAIGSLQPSRASHSGVWKVWSEAVERTRELRFTLDGNIVENEHFEDQTDECCQYKVENVAERDFLRTEGDPLAAGYTIKEAVALSRSVIPGQRAFALQLLASVLDRALNSLQKQEIALNMRNTVNTTKQIDWQAVWAYSLGPEPEIVLSLRIALDDNHISVVLASAKVIECILACHLNENYYNILEKPFIRQKSVCTAPVFRARPEIVNGFLHGGFWKYNTKPSNVLPSREKNEDEGNHTIQDDVVVAGQDVAAGLIRMGILPRICHLLEMDPLPSLEDSLLSVLIALARHSPICTSAIVKCARLLEVVVSRFSKFTSSIKSVILMRVLCEADKQNCVDFINCGFFQQITWQLFKPPLSLDDWVKSGRENCMLTSSLMTQQLRLWKVYIKYGYCLAYFPDFFPAICFWLNPTDFNKLMDKNVLGEFMSVAMEAYLVLAALSQRLPILHSLEQLNKHAKTLPVDGNTETWSWNHAVPMVDIGIKWLIFNDNPLAFGSDGLKKSSNETLLTCRKVEVVSAVMHMLSSIFNRIAADDAVCLNDSKHLPWLPDFVPKVGLEIVKNGFLNFLNSSGSECQIIGGRCSLVNKLCQWRLHGDFEMSLASAICLHALVCLLISTDKLIHRAKASKPDLHAEETGLTLEGKILEEGITKWAQNGLTEALNLFVNLITSRWQDLQFVEMFGRGGPAPGVGVGWGSCGGGFWSTAVSLAGADAQVILSLLEIFPIVTDKGLADFISTRSMNGQTSEFLFPILQKISSVLEICIVVRPEDKSTLEKAFSILLQAPVFNLLDFCTRHFLHLKGYKSFEWQFIHDDYLLFGNVLNEHFKNRWLRVKKKSSKNNGENNLNSKTSKKKASLETIDEESETMELVSKNQDDSSLRTEWAHQRLPLPMHWFLSPISTVGDIETAQCLLSSSKIQNKDIMPSEHASDVVRGGVFFLLGLEAMCHFLCIRTLDSPVMGVPLVWKLHALSMALLAKIEIFNEQKFRDVFETLQTVYGEYLVQFRYQCSEQRSGRSAATSEDQLSCRGEILDFQAQVHESYSTFIETLVEQFASISYGDVIYGRQIAVYLYRTVEPSVRLATWNALANAHVLELLPPLESCMGEPKGYLEPIEDNEGILEAYIKSWVTGALDKAATRGSMCFSLALHHLSSFIFHYHSHDKLTLRNKMVKSILRGFSRKQNQEDMVLKFINYEPQTPQQLNAELGISYQRSERERRFTILSEACEGNSSLLSEVEKLRSSTS